MFSEKKRAEKGGGNGEDMNLEVPPTNDLGLPTGWFTKEDVERYQLLCEEVPEGGTIVEIGVWQGRSLCSIAGVIKGRSLKVVAVDTFDGTPGVKVVHNAEGKLQEVFENNIETFGIRDHVTVMRGASAEIGNAFEGDVDLVFIDGEHSKEAVEKDVRAWWPKVAMGGKLAGHDYSFVKDFIMSGFERLGVRPEVKTDGKGDVWWISKDMLGTHHLS